MVLGAKRVRGRGNRPTLAMATGLLVMLSACGGGATTTTSAGSTETSETTAAAVGATTTATEEAGLFATSYDAIVAAAAQEDPVQWCTGMGDDEYGPLVAAFNSAYPEVPTPEAFECSGIEATERTLTEWQAGVQQVDVVDADTEILERLEAENLTHVQDWSVFDGSPLEIDDQVLSYNGRIVSVGYAQRIIAYNTELMTPEEVPQSIEECADPKYKGQIAIDVRPTWFEFMQEAGGPWDDAYLQEWAEGIAANEPLWVRGASQGYQVLASGERAIHCGLQLHGLFRGGRTDVDATDPIVWFILPERTITREYVRLAFAPEPRAPNGTILFGAWMASEGQIAIESVNPGYGSPFIEGTWISEQFAEEGSEILLASDQSVIAAVSDRMNEIILTAWGFPEAVPEE